MRERMGHHRAESVSQAGRATGRTDKSFERAVVGLSSVFFLSVCLFFCHSVTRGAICLVIVVVPLVRVCPRDCCHKEGGRRGGGGAKTRMAAARRWDGDGRRKTGTEMEMR